MLHFYDNPPTAQVQIPHHGSSSTASWHPRDPSNEHKLPRLIVENPQLGPDLVRFARNYLTTTLPPVPPFFQHLHDLATRWIGRDPLGDETHNWLLFKDVSNYIVEFVIAADQLLSDDVQVTPCRDEGGIRPNMMLQRKKMTKSLLNTKV